jgi:hypothetical protein
MGKKSAARKAEPKGNGKKGAGDAVKAGAAKRRTASPKGEISGKDYARDMKNSMSNSSNCKSGSSSKG